MKYPYLYMFFGLLIPSMLGGFIIAGDTNLIFVIGLIQIIVFSLAVLLFHYLEGNFDKGTREYNKMMDEKIRHWNKTENDKLYEWARGERELLEWEKNNLK